MIELELPTTPGLYVSENIDTAWAEPFALTAMGRWIWFHGGDITPEELQRLAPMVRLVPLTDDELDALHDVADQIARRVRLNAVAMDRWGTHTQADLTRELITADTWRAIAEKTKDR